MPRQQSKGACTYCGKELSKAGMTKHLVTCAQRQAAIATAEAKKGSSQSLYHLRIQDTDRKEFWLDVEMGGAKTLQDLDDYLRTIWLECCGHLSGFFWGGAFAREVAMRRKLSEAFKSGPELTHVYDFGTSSETLVKCVAVREGKPTTKSAIALMARNQMPAAECLECGQPATHLCMQCVAEDQIWGMLCEAHLESHPHGDDYGDPLPLVNSPRLGLCGYDGPAEAPD